MEKTRVRFAPAPTGLMHIGNIRTALLNYLYALKNNGTFVLRIEDTDPERNFDPQAHEILKDLNWLNIQYDEGPEKEGPYKPYFQSQRTALYQEYLDKLAKDKKIYRCFCTTEELEKKRNRQIALKQPPRYDKTCLKLTYEQIEKNLQNKVPFVWRFEVKPDKEIELEDISKGKLQFNTNNLTDFPITRQNGSFTFLFANAIDDILMNITHIFRGEDHLSNSANQILIYKAFNTKVPKFFHMPIICNLEGKKLSKRDQGFSLRDLQKEGFIPEAINNYLAILGKSFENEILSVNELATKLDFENSGASQIKYDLEKLKWINHKWISRLPIKELIDRCLPILKETYPEAQNLNHEKLAQLIGLVQPELTTLNDIKEKVEFLFIKPQVSNQDLESIKKYSEHKNLIKEIIIGNLNNLEDPEKFILNIKKECKENDISLAILFPILRLSLTGKKNGPNIIDIVNIIGVKESKDRLLKTLI